MSDAVTNAEPGAHLHPTARALLDAPIEVRLVTSWKKIWIGHSNARQVHAELDRLLVTPPSIRPRNLLIFGESGVGKSTILTRWTERVRTEAAVRAEHEDPETLGDWAVLPVVKVQTPPRGDETRLYNNILEDLGFPLPASYSVAEKERTVRRLLRQNRTRAIILDEFHNALSGRFDQRLHFNVVIKNMSNETGIPFVVAGTSSVDQVFRKEDQLHRRFSRIKLERWGDDADWRRLLRSFEKLIPLKWPSGLGEPEMASLLHSISNGVIGELSEALYQAALRAAETGEERISAASLRGGR